MSSIVTKELRNTIRFTPTTELAPAWEKPRGMPHILWRVLRARGVESADEAFSFLNPTKRDIIDPMALHGMAEATAVIKKHIAAGSRVCVWGDYDVDGVSAAAILLSTLRKLKTDVSWHIPSRHDEGYGLNLAGVLSLGCDLLITVDCGISEREIIDEAARAGISVIVTDHHKPPASLPDCPVVNPLLGGCANPHLCGAGVAFKLALALDPGAFDMIDIAALATIADVVPLAGENRAIAKLGLERMNADTRKGIAALLRVAGIEGEIMSHTVAYQISPRLNASGRLADANVALRLLTTDDEKEADALASELDALNRQRRKMEKRVLDDCESQLQSYDFISNRAIILAGEGWNPGVVGLAASRLVERWTMPAVLLARDGEWMTGSCRSIPGVNIHAHLTAVAEHIKRFGGHSQAAGLTIEASKFEDFKAALNRRIATSTPEEAFIPSQKYDCEASIADFTPDAIRALSAMEPTGFGNPPPAFMSAFHLADARRMGSEGAHASFTAADAHDAIRGVWFGAGGDIKAFGDSNVEAICEPALNEFRGEITRQLRIKAMKRDPASALDAFRDEERLINPFITQGLYNRPIAAQNEAIGMDEIAARLKNPKGTLIVAGDIPSAKRVCQAAEDGFLDVYFGCCPKDPRGFNALCLLPEGVIPEGYDVIACAGVPSWMVSPAARDVRGIGRAWWLEELPGVEELRSIYVACRDLSASAGVFSGAIHLAREISTRSGVGHIAVQAGLMALGDMELIEYDPASAKLSMRPFRRADPRESEVFGIIARLRTWGGA